MTTEAMTTEGAAYRAPRSRRGLRDLPNRMSLRAKLITGLLALVIVAVAAISISSAWVLRSYLTSQDDTQLRPPCMASTPTSSAATNRTSRCPGRRIP